MTRACLWGAVAAALSGCGSSLAEGDWTPVAVGETDAFMSINGLSRDDLWVVGADHGIGPSVLHRGPDGWTRVTTGTSGDLWWAHPVDANLVFLGGEGGTVLRGNATDGFVRDATPGAGHETVFGVWASGADDAWAVGGYAGRAGFVWHDDGSGWQRLLLPLDIPRRDDGELPPILKVWGDGEGTVWMVGGEGTILRSVDNGPLEVVPSPVDATLFTVHGAFDKLCIVGQSATGGVVLEYEKGEWVDETPEGTPLLQGVAMGPGNTGVATGAIGQLLTRARSGWSLADDVSSQALESLHAVWIDPDGGQWAVGGNVLSAALDDGAVLYRGEDLPDAPPDRVLPTPVDPSVCPAAAIDPKPDGSMARRWNEQILNAIRRDIPRPGVHARNLYHLAVVQWDVWAAFDATADGVVYTEKETAADVEAARAEAIAYASYRLLAHRYSTAIGGVTSKACFDAFLAQLGFDATNTSVDGDTPAALGNRVAAAVIATFAEDGANEATNYADPAGYTSPNPTIIFDQAGVDIVDPDAWTPLNLAVAVTQNGIPVSAGDQVYIGSQWGQVTPFSLDRTRDGTPYLQAIDEPRFANPEMKDWVVDVIQKTAWLDPNDDTTIDASPGKFGNNPLGTNDGTGHATNGVTGAPYAANVVKRSDFGRVLAEYWADGPKSETPPGHWDKIANQTADDPDLVRKLWGAGETLDALSWDVHMYLAVDGAVHDAAIAAWDQKREYALSRPIQLIRYMAGLGQSTDPAGPAYHVDGLPLVEGLIEVITEESAAPGQRHQHLRHFVGEVAVYTWRGEPGDRANDEGGHDWVRGKEWIPYQRRSFVTPAFPGYISGHSTFSRAAARTLTELTGSPWFPGGLASFEAPTGAYLVFEDGPSAPLQLQWGTYFDAADQAGQSRIWGGIHIWPDDTGGRQTGEDVGFHAVAKAKTYFEGTAR